MLDNFKVILWDFDGVIMDSMPIRSKGFEVVLKDFPQDQVDKLLAFHNQNGGLSRYVKFRYFFEELRGEPVTDEQVLALAEDFSVIMLKLLIDKNLLIADSVKFIEQNHNNFEMHIVSGSDQTELRKICEGLNLGQYFKTINGSPTPKKQLVKEVIQDFRYDKSDVVLIGDSKNDFDACVANNINFLGYNNEELKLLSPNYAELLCQ